MITKPLFRKTYFIFVSVTLVSIFIAFASTWIMARVERDRNFPRFRPTNMMRGILLELDADPIKAVKKLTKATQDNPMMRFDLINAEGMSLISHQRVIPQPLTTEQLTRLKSEGTLPYGDGLHGERPHPPRPPLIPGGPPGPPGGPGGPPRPPPFEIFPSPTEGAFFVAIFNAPKMPPPPNLMLITVIALVTCTLISVGIALLYQFSKYRERANEAFNILNELKHGNLAARMPSKKFDELAPLVTAFNHMADDLERMVENLRKADHARRQLLQDLAHDLRTPLTSLNTFLETLQHSSQKISEDKRQEMLALCFTEVEYFGRLVEDLLFLAQITEPKYSIGAEEINLSDRISEQISIFKTRYPHLKYQLILPEANPTCVVMGSSKLVDRLLRNAFENSSSFARSHLRIELTEETNSVRVHLSDDGEGFSEKALKEFGSKKASRVLSGDTHHQRISVGIGSVIMKEIAQLHSGDIKAENIFDADGIAGAKVSFLLSKT
ncbi:Sensor histidine kinase MtrB [compost metagenome]